MPVDLLKTRDTDSTLHFPLGGINVASAFAKQPNVPIDQEIGWYARTTPAAFNVRAFDQLDGQTRGGSRGGLTRYIRSRLPGGIMNINSVVVVNPEDAVQSSSSGRQVTGVFVANGNVRIAGAGASVYTTPTNGTGALNATGVVFSAPNNGKLFFADGTNYKYYDPADNTVHAWVATAGTLPADGDGNKPRLICTWHGCTVLSGLLGDPQNLYLSKVGDSFNFDYSPTPASPLDAVALNASPLGRIGDVVTCLISFTDDVLIIGCDHEIWCLQGHPNDGGRLVRATDAVGMAWGSPWCSDPQGNIYFFGSDCGIYRVDPLSPRPQPVRISHQIDPQLATVNTGANTISMAWDRAQQGFYCFVTRTAGPYRAVHLFYEARTNGWFNVRFKNRMHNPLCCYVFDGNTPTDRVVLIGSWDGYLRFLDPAATKDDGENIESSVVIGPLLTNNLDKIIVLAMQAVLGERSGQVRYEILVGRTSQEALSSTPTLSGYWDASASGRNFTVPVNRDGYAVYLKMSATEPWAMESVRATVRGLGPVLRRGA